MSPEPARPLTVALLGGGTVGSQVARLITENAHDFAERVGVPVAAGDPRRSDHR
jgi:homoserine dehydrogenase